METAPPGRRWFLQLRLHGFNHRLRRDVEVLVKRIDRGRSAKRVHADEAPLVADYRRLMLDVRHVFTHFALRLEIFVAEVAATTQAPGDCRWVDENALGEEALPSLMRKVVVAIRSSDQREV